MHSSAVPADNPERQLATGRGIPQMKRGEFLALISTSYKRTAAVSGSHGKSTISAMLAHILAESGLEPGFMIGAKVRGGSDHAAGNGDAFVTEADESDGTHKLLRPWLGVIPNCDDDHAWGLGGSEALFENYREFSRNCDHIVAGDSPECRTMLHGIDKVEFVREPEGRRLGKFFGYQAVDANMAIAAAKWFGIDAGRALEALGNFGGVDRRMTVRHETPGIIVVEDYAHHPTEVKCSLEWLRENWPKHHLRVVFQPHRYARLKRYFDDFASVLKTADSVVIAPVFAAWTETGSIGSAELAKAIGAETGSADFGELAKQALDRQERPLLVAVLGAGDVANVFGPIVKLLEK
ncbi:MAG: hypothetical protein MJ025_07160 [Victivallaceae bacterium]|nr:hypothetical protein [Victivallaceae bacterium]